MYSNYFKLKESPFLLTPDPRFFYLSERHRDAMAHLMYGIQESGGFLVLSGEVGTGKTILCRTTLLQLPKDINVALILNPKLTAIELMETICDELGVTYPIQEQGIKGLFDRLNRHLLATHKEGRQTVLIIDEAQGLAVALLEQLRLLTNLETHQKKLLRIILIGQPELIPLLSQNSLRQLAQRVTASCIITPLNSMETKGYIQHRLSIAGCLDWELFSQGALRWIFRLSGGIPRLINKLCDRALLIAYAKNHKRVHTWLAIRAGIECLLPFSPGLLKIGLLRGGLDMFVRGMVLVSFLFMGGYLFWSQPSFKMSKPDVSVIPTISHSALLPIKMVFKKREKTLESMDPQGPTLQQPSLTLLLGKQGQKEDLRRAYQTLFGQWGVDPKTIPTDGLCEHANKIAMECTPLTGSWKILRTLNLPVILMLEHSNHQKHPVVATHMDADHITLHFGKIEWAYSLKEVEKYWFGHSMIVWKTPPITHKPLKLGDQNEDILWLRERLSHVTGESLTTDTPLLFDEALLKQIKAFQTKHDFVPDGIIDTLTLILLQSHSRGLPSLLGE